MAQIIYLTEDEAAKKARVSKRKLQRMRAEGHGPCYIRVGVRRILYADVDIDRWMSANTFRHRADELARAALVLSGVLALVGLIGSLVPASAQAGPSTPSIRTPAMSSSLSSILVWFAR
jgi:hypothetical protein